MLEKDRDFYGLFPLGRHACGGQSQLDMPERFLLENNMGGGGGGGGGIVERQKKELAIEWAREKEQKEQKREKSCNPIHYVFSWQKEDGMTMVEDASL